MLALSLFLFPAVVAIPALLGWSARNSIGLYSIAFAIFATLMYAATGASGVLWAAGAAVLGLIALIVFAGLFGKDVSDGAYVVILYGIGLFPWSVSPWGSVLYCAPFVIAVLMKVFASRSSKDFSIASSIDWVFGWKWSCLAVIAMSAFAFVISVVMA